MTKGQRILALRKYNKVTQEELALKLGVAKQTVYKYEHDIITNIPSDKLEIMAKVLGTSPEYILGWECDTVTEDMQKNSDTAVGITIRLGADADFREIVKRNYSDAEFCELSRMLCKMDAEQIESVKGMLRAFFK